MPLRMLLYINPILNHILNIVLKKIFLKPLFLSILTCFALFACINDGNLCSSAIEQTTLIRFKTKIKLKKRLTFADSIVFRDTLLIVKNLKIATTQKPFHIKDTIRNTKQLTMDSGADFTVYTCLLNDIPTSFRLNYVREVRFISPECGTKTRFLTPTLQLTKQTQPFDSIRFKQLTNDNFEIEAYFFK